MNGYLYRDCGLENVFLMNGFTRRETPYGVTYAIDDVDGLHAAVARALAKKPVPLSGAEFRFLRQYLKMSQRRFGELLDKDEQSVAKWEKEDNVPRYAEPAIRNLVREKLGGNAEVTGLLEQLAAADHEEYKARLEFSKSKRRWALNRRREVA